MMKNIIILAILCFSLQSEATSPWDTIDPNNFDAKLMEEQVLDQINLYRKQKNVSFLFANPKIKPVSDDHLNYLKKTGEFSHEQSTPGKRTIQDRFVHYTKARSYAVAENLAKTFVLKPTHNYTASGSTQLSTAYTYRQAAIYMFNAWKASPSHHTNMVNPRYKWTGLSIYLDPKTKAMTAVQVFARID